MTRDWLNITAEEYHAYDAISSGGLRCFIKDGPLAYWHKYMSGEKKPETDAMRLGTAFHSAMEVPDSWMDHYLIAPSTIQKDEFYEDVDDELGDSKAERPPAGAPIYLRRKFDSMWVQKWKDFAASQGRAYVTEDEVRSVKCMVQSVYDSPAFCEFLPNPEAWVEQAIVLYRTSGLKTKALCDYIHHDESFFVDWKTTRRMNMSQFWRDFRNLGYAYQLAHYCVVSGIYQCKIGVVRNEPPWEANLISFEWGEPIPDIGASLADLADEIEGHLQRFESSSLMADSGGSVDSQGCPPDFHNEMWGTEIPASSVLGNTPDYDFGAEEEVEVVG